MGKEIGLSVDVKQLNNIAIMNHTPGSGFRNSLSGDYLPKIIGIIMSISGNLLAWGSFSFSILMVNHSQQTLATDTAILVRQRVIFSVRVQKDFGILVLHGNDIMITNFWSLMSKSRYT